VGEWHGAVLAGLVGPSALIVDWKDETSVMVLRAEVLAALELL